MKVQEILARGVCIKNGAILLAYYKPKDYYFLPGGHVEAGEPIFVALKREIQEETGLVAIIGDMLAVFEHAWNNDGKSIHEINFLISFSVPDDLEIYSRVEHLAFEWVSFDMFKEINFLPTELRKDILLLLQNRPISRFKSSILCLSPKV